MTQNDIENIIGGVFIGVAIGVIACIFMLFYFKDNRRVVTSVQNTEYRKPIFVTVNGTLVRLEYKQSYP